MYIFVEKVNQEYVKVRHPRYTHLWPTQDKWNCVLNLKFYHIVTRLEQSLVLSSQAKLKFKQVNDKRANWEQASILCHIKQ